MSIGTQIGVLLGSSIYHRSGPPPAVDPHISSTTLLLGFDEADGSTSTQNEAPSGSSHTITFAGNAHCETASPLIGSASLQLDGTNDWVSIPSSSDWYFGDGEFTVELSVRYATVASGGLIGTWEGTAGLRQWMIWFTGGNLHCFLSTSGESASLDISASWSPSVGVRYDIAIDRDASGTVRLYVDGVMIASGSEPGALYDNSSPLLIGTIDGGSPESNEINGYIDEVRITKGVARYASDEGYAPSVDKFPRA